MVEILATTLSVNFEGFFLILKLVYTKLINKLLHNMNYILEIHNYNRRVMELNVNITKLYNKNDIVKSSSLWQSSSHMPSLIWQRQQPNCNTHIFTNTKTQTRITCSVSNNMVSLSTTILYLLVYGVPNDWMLQWDMQYYTVRLKGCLTFHM